MTFEQLVFLKAQKQPGRPIWWKAIGDQIHINESSRKASGYLASFGTRDDEADVLIKGCFAKSIAEHGPESGSTQKIAYLWMHEMKEPVGRFTVLKEDDFGLYFEALVSKIALGDRLIEQYNDGTLNQHSIGFRYIWDKCMWGDWKGEESFICYELMLKEGSVVTLGMNENTPFTGMKGNDLMTEAMVLDREMEKLLGKLSPKESMELRRLISKHISLTEARFEPARPLNSIGEPGRKERNESLINYIKSLQ